MFPHKIESISRYLKCHKSSKFVKIIELYDKCKKLNNVLGLSRVISFVSFLIFYFILMMTNVVSNSIFTCHIAVNK